jgi:TPR repeat protein
MMFYFNPLEIGSRDERFFSPQNPPMLEGMGKERQDIIWDDEDAERQAAQDVVWDDRIVSDAKAGPARLAAEVLLTLLFMALGMYVWGRCSDAYHFSPGGIANLRYEASQGDADKQTRLGVLYEEGEAVTRDDAFAAKWFEEAASLGNKTAQRKIAEMYETGRGVKQDNGRAAVFYGVLVLGAAENVAARDKAMARLTARQKIRAEKHVADWYADPRHLPDDVAALRKNVEKGSAEDEFALWRVYQEISNGAEALKWLRLSAAHGYPRAQEALAGEYEKGGFVRQDYAEAYVWYSLSARPSARYSTVSDGADAAARVAKHLSPAQLDAAKKRAAAWRQKPYAPLAAWVPTYDDAMQDFYRAYNRGDSAEAVRIIRPWAARGNADAQVKLGWLTEHGEGVERDDAAAMTWYRKAAQHGFVPSWAMIGSMYLGDKDIPRDDAAAMRWYLKAANRGNAAGQYGVGYMYHSGRGVNKDYAQAMTWLRKAAAQGDLQATYMIGRMYFDGRGVKQDYEEAYFWLSLGTADYTPSLRYTITGLFWYAVLRNDFELTPPQKALVHLTYRQYQEVRKRVGDWRPVTVSTN